MRTISLAEGADTDDPEPPGDDRAGSAPPVVGVGARRRAAVVSLPVLGGLLAMLSPVRSGRALDQAIISWRAYDVFSGSSPALGQLTQVCRVEGRPVFSPGPLLYWLLAVPVHLDPRTGALVGGVRCCSCSPRAPPVWRPPAPAARARPGSSPPACWSWSGTPCTPSAPTPVWNPNVGAGAVRRPAGRRVDRRGRTDCPGCRCCSCWAASACRPI